MGDHVVRGAGLKVLVIDDEAPIRQIIKTALERHGFVVVESEDGRDGMKQTAADNPALVITDLVMPDQEGLETIQMLRQRFPSVKIIAMSGNGQMLAHDLLSVAKRFGASGVLAKPFSIDALLAEVEKALGMNT